MASLAPGLLALGFLLAFVNGANDVSKGIATLVGGGVTDYRRAIWWGTGWTAAGALAAGGLATAMVATFSAGLFVPGTQVTQVAALATLAGAVAWVLAATRWGLPVSTTHAIVGSFVGVGVFAYGVHGILWNALAMKIVVPLLVAPVASLGTVMILLRAWRALTGRGGGEVECACTYVEPAPQSAGGASVSAAFALRTSTGTREACAQHHPGALRITVDQMHWFTSGTASLARGMNDAPKLVALIAGAAVMGGNQHLPLPWMFLLVSLGMTAGSIAAGTRVTRVLAEKVTPLDHREGFVANAVTAALVITGATLGWPMSTTHVSSGGIVGVGIQRSSLNVRTLREMAMAWIITVPCAAALGITAYLVLRQP